MREQFQMSKVMDLGWVQESGQLRQADSSPDNRSAAAHLMSLFGRRSSGQSGGAQRVPILKRTGSGTQPMCLNLPRKPHLPDDFQVNKPSTVHNKKIPASQSCDDD